MDIPSTAAGETPAADQERWFVEEVHPLEASLKGYLRGSFPSVRDIDDVVQESYVRIWRARAVRPIRSARSFLFQVARHISLDLVRRHLASPIDPVAEISHAIVADEGLNSAEFLTAREKLDLLSDALVALPRQCRNVVILHKIKGLSQREVAEKLGLSERTVENQCRIGLAKCETFLRDRGVTGFQFE